MQRTRSGAPRFLHTLVQAGLVALLAVGLTAGSAFAAKGGGSGGSGSTIRMVPLDSTDGYAHYGQHITFAITTSNQYPVASVSCSQGGVVVYGDSRPMYQPNPWNDPGIFTLSSLSWTGGAADCTADLKGTSHGKVVTLASTAFHVYP